VFLLILFLYLGTRVGRVSFWHGKGGADGLGQNCSMMSEYMTHMGRIRHRKDTGLRAVNQRKIAKAIRRAVGMGLVPSVHRHPEVLEVQAKARNLKKWLKEKGKVGAVF